MRRLEQDGATIFSLKDRFMGQLCYIIYKLSKEVFQVSSSMKSVYGLALSVLLARSLYGLTKFPIALDDIRMTYYSL